MAQERRKNNRKRNNYIKVATIIGVIQIILIVVSISLQFYANNRVFEELEQFRYAMSEADIASMTETKAFVNLSVFLCIVIIFIAVLLLWFNIELLNRFNKDVRRQNKHEGCIDELTGVWNRKYIDKYLPAYIRKKGSGFLYMCDMDNFKKINDTLGHDVGDEVLKDFADVLRRILRDEDRICRLGGDEFMLYVPAIDDKTAKLVYERLRDALINRFAGTKKSIVTLSCGATPISSARNFEANYKRADEALYYVKESGKNSFCILK